MAERPAERATPPQEADRAHPRPETPERPERAPRDVAATVTRPTDPAGGERR